MEGQRAVSSYLPQRLDLLSLFLSISKAGYRVVEREHSEQWAEFPRRIPLLLTVSLVRAMVQRTGLTLVLEL